MTVLSLDSKRSRADLAAAGEKQQVEEVVKFAGVEYNIKRRAAAASGGSAGIDKVLAAMDGPKKVSTIEKTSIDWDKFKEKEGIEDELTQYTKDGCVLLFELVWLEVAANKLRAGTSRSRSSCSGSTSSASRLKRPSETSSASSSNNSNRITLQPWWVIQYLLDARLELKAVSSQASGSSLSRRRAISRLIYLHWDDVRCSVLFRSGFSTGALAISLYLVSTLVLLTLIREC